MKITYDKILHIAYISIKKGQYLRSVEVGKKIVIDITKDGNIMGIEIRDVKSSKGITSLHTALTTKV